MRRVNTTIGALLAGALLGAPAIAADERAAQIAACNTYAHAKTGEGAPSASPPAGAPQERGPVLGGPPRSGAIQAPGTGAATDPLLHGMAPIGETSALYRDAFRECMQSFQAGMPAAASQRAEIAACNVYADLMVSATAAASPATESRPSVTPSPPIRGRSRPIQAPGTGVTGGESLLHGMSAQGVGNPEFQQAFLECRRKLQG
jgi:hypothetical protein